MSNDTESELYSRLGASSSKAGLHAVLDKLGSSSSNSKLFAQITDDVAGDKDYFSLLHADSAGTKTILAYLAFRETGDANWFRTLAQDSLVMNLDDIACVGGLDNLLLNNTIARNRRLIPDTALEVIISEYQRLCQLLAEYNINIKLCGGETEDLGDVVRTLSVGSTLFARAKRSKLIDTVRIQAGDLIVGFANTGQAEYEQSVNSGIASNGLTLARAALVADQFKIKYPEISDSTQGLERNSEIPALFEKHAELGCAPIQALLSPTRTYAPLVKRLLDLESDSSGSIHALIHCTGGGQTKILRFGNHKRYIKDALFPVPPIFKLIQQMLNVPWKEMYSVFNMGHRLELICPAQFSDQAIKISQQLGIEAKIIGRVEDLKPGSASELLLKNAALEGKGEEFLYRV